MRFFLNMEKFLMNKMNDNTYSVKVDNLSVKFGDFYAVKNISFTVKKGEIFGFLGANGAGKTTTIRVLCGLLYPTEGNVVVEGIRFDNNKDDLSIKKKVGYMSQKFTLYNDLTVEENLSFIASLRNLDKKTYLDRRDFILHFISFQKPLDSFVRDLPGGIKQQVSLAAAILHDPDIVFLDEPTAGVTPLMRARFWALIHDLTKLQKTVFVTTHYMDEAEQCERIALMRTAEIIALDTPSNLKKHFFPEGIYEFSAKKDMNYAYIKKLSQNSGFDYFEAYGLKFHVVFKKNEEANALKKSLPEDFEMRLITPTLEDVFIEASENKGSNDR